MRASDFIREKDIELAMFLDEELKNTPECRYPTNCDYIPTSDELKSFTDDELTDILMDSSLDADMSFGEQDFEFLTKRYNLIKELVTKERDSRKNEVHHC